MGKKKFPILRNKKGHPIFSREDMREQYCITKKELDSLEEQGSSTTGLFRCVQTPQKIKFRGSGLFSCVQKNRSRSEEDIDKLKSTFIKSATWSPKSHGTFFAQEENKEPFSSCEYFKPRPRPQSYCAADMARRRQVFGGLTERTMTELKSRSKVVTSHNGNPSPVLCKQNPDVIPHSHSGTPVSRHVSKDDHLSSPILNRPREILSSTENKISSTSPVFLPRTHFSNLRTQENPLDLPEGQKHDKHVSFNSLLTEDSSKLNNAERILNNSSGTLPYVKRGFSSEERLLQYGINNDFNPSDKSATLPPLQRRRRRPNRSTKSQATQTDYMGMCFLPDYLFEGNYSNLQNAFSTGSIGESCRTKIDAMSVRSLVPTAAELKSAAQATIAQIENLSQGSNKNSTPFLNQRKILASLDKSITLPENLHIKGVSSTCPSPPIPSSPILNGHITRETASLPGSPSRSFMRNSGKSNPILNTNRTHSNDSSISRSPGSPFLSRLAMFQENLQKQMSANLENEKQILGNSSKKPLLQDNGIHWQSKGNVAGQHMEYNKLQNAENAFLAAQTNLLQQMLKNEVHYQSIPNLSPTSCQHNNKILKNSSSTPTTPIKKQDGELMLKLLFQRKQLQETPAFKIENMVDDLRNGNFENKVLPPDGEGNLISDSADDIKISHVRDAIIFNCDSSLSYSKDIEQSLYDKSSYVSKDSESVTSSLYNSLGNKVQNSESQTAITVGNSKINQGSSHLRVLSAEMETLDQTLFKNPTDVVTMENKDDDSLTSISLISKNSASPKMVSSDSMSFKPIAFFPNNECNSTNQLLTTSTSLNPRDDSFPISPSSLENQNEFLSSKFSPLPPPSPLLSLTELTLDEVLNELSSIQETKGSRSPAAFPLVVEDELLKDATDKSDASSILDSTRSDLSGSKKDCSQIIETFENVNPSKMPDLPKDSPCFVKRIKDELSSQESDSIKSSSVESSPYRSFHSPSRFESPQRLSERKRISYHGDSSMYQQMAPVIAELAARERQKSAEDMSVSQQDQDIIAAIGRRDSCGSNTSSRCDKPENAEIQRLRSRRSIDSYRSSSDDTSDDEDIGVYMDSYRNSAWFYVGDTEELAIAAMSAISEEVKRRSHREDLSDDSARSSTVSSLSRAESLESTASEREFRKRYQAVTRRMVHRKSIIEMYKRLSTKTFESDKVLIIERKNGEFGFRIHGSRPVVASAVDKGGPADLAGLMMGDIIITLNGINVLDMTHTDVVQLAQQSSDIIQLEIARIPPTTKHPLLEDDPQKPIICGYLYKLAGSGLLKRWHRRWFVLKKDNFLYYYKNEKDKEPLGAIMLQNFIVSKSPDVGRAHAFKISKFASAVHHFAAESEEDMNRWAGWMNHAVSSAQNMDTWLEISTRNIQLPALSIHNPDCHGYLIKLGKKRKTWRRRYCVLKDACIYFFVDMNSTSALGIAHLHGFTIQENTSCGKKFAFDLLPPEEKLRHFTFQAESLTDMKRWTAALEYSIGRWIKVD